MRKLACNACPKDSAPAFEANDLGRAKAVKHAVKKHGYDFELAVATIRELLR